MTISGRSQLLRHRIGRCSRLLQLGFGWPALVLAAAILFGPSVGPAASADWTLDPTRSTLTYQSVKKNSIVESNTIRNISGMLSSDGYADITFDLNSVDTAVDLRNVRMRFLFFETYKYPTATLTAKVDPAAFADLPNRRRMSYVLPFRLDLHGMQKDMEARVVVTMIDDNLVSVASESPIVVHVEDFGLLENIEKLKLAANVSSIVPVASVSFDFIFSSSEKLAPAVETVAAAAPADAGPIATDASKDVFGDEECTNRFDVLSRTGAIYFRTASARLQPESKPLLDELVSVVRKCPKLKVEISGHTDSDGSPEANSLLSERRAKAVAEAIRAAGIPASQLHATGYGEDRPIVPNDTDRNKALNRRIEFTAIRAGT